MGFIISLLDRVFALIECSRYAEVVSAVACQSTRRVWWAMVTDDPVPQTNSVEVVNCPNIAVDPVGLMAATTEADHLSDGTAATAARLALWFSAIGSHPRKPQRNFALFIAITFPIAPSLQIAPTSKPGGRELLVRHEGTGRR
jgi:hypothetical protein